MKNLIKLFNSNIIAENSNYKILEETLNITDKNITIKLNYSVDGLNKSDWSKLLIFQNENSFLNYKKWIENNSFFINDNEYIFAEETNDFFNIYIALLIPNSNKNSLELKKSVIEKLKKIEKIIIIYKSRYLNL